ncbi:MAG: M20/M25/M40 family metallo-hydrolase, partial [Longimicrobiales bacterium]
MRDLSFERALAFARDLIRIPSLPGDEGALAARALQELEALRFDDAWIDDAGNVLGRVRGSGGGATVMLSCHLDAVDVGDASSWRHGPFAADVADGFLHGRGAMDIKGPLALQTYAAAGFLDGRPPGDVIIAHTVLEERGGLGMDTLMRTGQVRPDAVIIGEATSGDIAIGHR